MTPDRTVTGTLPLLVEPQAIVNGSLRGLFDPVTSLVVEVAPEIAVRTYFEGDLFETEDQRNWTDASFKTYSTPLALGPPHTSRPDQRFDQSVTITCASGKKAKGRTTVREPITITLGSEAGRTLPALGLGVASARLELTEREVELLRRLRLDHLRVDLHLEAPDWSDRLERALDQSRRLNCGVELALHLRAGGLPSVERLASTVGSHAVARILVLDAAGYASQAEPVHLVRARLAGRIDAPDGGGTDLSFAESNRSHRDAAGFDFLAYPISPQVHASDERSLVENLSAQADTVRSARAFSDGLPVVVTPVTLRPRSDPGPADPRQRSLFCAAWTVGSLKRLAHAGMDSVTFYETVGRRGVLEGADPPVPVETRQRVPRLPCPRRRWRVEELRTPRGDL